jgi:hypothetical protein
MNIDFNAAFDAGLTDEDIMNMMQKQMQEAKEKRQAEIEAKAKAEQEKINKEARSAAKEHLKEEGRAYAINALICYSQAFDLLEDGEEWDDEDVAKAEEVLKKLEDMIPLYIKLAQMQGEMDKHFGLDDDFFKGLF